MGHLYNKTDAYEDQRATASNADLPETMESLIGSIQIYLYQTESVAKRLEETLAGENSPKATDVQLPPSTARVGLISQLQGIRNRLLAVNSNLFSIENIVHSNEIIADLSGRGETGATVVGSFRA